MRGHAQHAAVPWIDGENLPSKTAQVFEERASDSVLRFRGADHCYGAWREDFA